MIATFIKARAKTLIENFRLGADICSLKTTPNFLSYQPPSKKSINSLSHLSIKKSLAKGANLNYIEIILTSEETMDLSYFLAKFFGVYYLIFAVLWVLRQEQLKEVIKDLIGKPAILSVTGVISLMLGVAIAVTHSIWTWNFQGLITLIAYLAILKGIIRLSFPKQDKELAMSLLKGKGYWFTFLVMAVIGLYLTYVGFGIQL